jgi:hypothetical protein
VAHVELADGTVLPDETARITVVTPAALDFGAGPDPETPGATPAA